LGGLKGRVMLLMLPVGGEAFAGSTPIVCQCERDAAARTAPAAVAMHCHAAPRHSPIATAGLHLVEGAAPGLHKNR